MVMLINCNQVDWQIANCPSTIEIDSVMERSMIVLIRYRQSIIIWLSDLVLFQSRRARWEWLNLARYNFLLKIYYNLNLYNFSYEKHKKPMMISSNTARNALKSGPMNSWLSNINWRIIYSPALNGRALSRRPLWLKDERKRELAGQTTADGGEMGGVVIHI